MLCSNSPARWMEVPVPPEPKLIAPGFAFAYLMSSETDPAGRATLASRMCGVWLTKTTGLSCSGLNGKRSYSSCLLYTSDAADERSSVDLGGRRIIKKKKK